MKERNWSTKALIPCVNLTQVLEQLHSQKIANYTCKLHTKETEYGAEH